MILVFIRNVLEWLKDSFEWGLHKVKYTVTRIAVVITFFIVLLWFSVFFYASFYYAYMPPISLTKPVNLQFSVCENGVGMCSYPTANMTLVKTGQSVIFASGEAYSITMEIELPESPANKELGMFMVRLQLYDRLGDVVATSSRSVLLRFRSELLRVLDTFVFSPLLLSGFTEQKQTLRVEFYNNYKDDAYNPAIGAVIEVQSRKVDIYAAKLNIHAHFTGLRYMLFYWPLLSATVGITFNMTFLGFIALLSWTQLLWNGKKKENVYNNSMQDEKSEKRKSMEERRRNLRAMLNKERDALVQKDNQKYSGETSSESRYGSETEFSRVDTVGTRESVCNDGPEETLLLSKDPVMADVDTDLRKRHTSATIS